MKFAMMMSAGIALALGGTAVAQDQGSAMGGGRGGDTSSATPSTTGSMGGGMHHTGAKRMRHGHAAMHKRAMGKSSASATSGRSPGSDGMTPAGTTSPR